jgi:hypothetical protein
LIGTPAHRRKVSGPRSEVAPNSRANSNLLPREFGATSLTRHSLATRDPGRRALPTRFCTRLNLAADRSGYVNGRRGSGKDAAPARMLWTSALPRAAGSLSTFLPPPVLPGWAIVGWTVGQRRDSCELGPGRRPHPRNAWPPPRGRSGPAFPPQPEQDY